MRDCKKYIDEQGYRKIPIGYASNDDASIRKNLANYFVCKLDEDEDNYSRADFLLLMFMNGVDIQHILLQGIVI